MLTNQEIKKRIEKCEKLGWWYQPMVYKDIKVKCRLAGPEVNPISYGIGKFNNYIKPHLNIVDWKDKFCEIGTNSGLFLVEAAKLGFNEVIGIEGSELFIEQLKLTKDVYNDINMKIYYNRLGSLEKSHGNNKCNILNLNDMPIVSVTTICNFHYWIEEKVFDKYINELSSKSEYVIIVTEENLNRVVNSSSNLLVNKMKQKWDIINTIKTDSTVLNNSNKKTRNLTSILFKSKVIDKMEVNKLWKYEMKLPDAVVLFGKIWYNFVNKFKNKKIKLSDVKDTELYKFYSTFSLPKIRKPMTEEDSENTVLDNGNLVYDLNKYGQKKAIKLNYKIEKSKYISILENNYLRFYPQRGDPWDGHHRLATYYYEKKKYIYIFVEVYEKLSNSEKKNEKIDNEPDECSVYKTEKWAKGYKDYDITKSQNDKIVLKYNKYLSNIFNNLKTSFNKKINVLDIACGTGRYFWLCKNVKSLVGLDYSKTMLKEADIPINNHICKRNIDEIILVNKDYMKVDEINEYFAEKFHFIYSIGFLSEYGNPTKINVEFIDKLYDLLVKDGELFLSVLEDNKYCEKILKDSKFTNSKIKIIKTQEGQHGGKTLIFVKKGYKES
jgi:2-polyprenyl-3-methyl-5-hydroxy-6-metoxy-1,4-benzoquinol methylase